ncbi:MAG TPA: phosphomannomutase [Candidatus Krumholzibacteria bacterium]|nr:phosphomannomutase [Candidatus Krumholzibacteria bacterium]
MTDLPSFIKAYDIRGRVPQDFDADFARRLGRALAAEIGTGTWCVGRDARDSSPALAAAVAAGLNEGGARVLDLGLCGTEQTYHATASRDLTGGVMVTASHNPLGYNGMKLVREGARPISGDTGLHEIARRALNGDLPAPAATPGETVPTDLTAAYRDFLLGFVDRAALKPLKVVADAGNGCAGPAVDLLAPHLPFEFVRLHHEPDPTFPHGIPNPLLPENRAATAAAVREHGADVGLAWDGDFDRCFFFDGTGAFVEGYYLVGLLARAALRLEPGGRIIHDPRLTWNTVDVVNAAGGTPVMNKTGHAFIKERMRAEDAVYGGEMSAHHYFRDFAYCDSGMVPWLLVLQEMSLSGRPLSELVGAMQAAYPASGEINRRIGEPERALREAEERWAPGAVAVDHTDGLSVDHADWRFNLRMSNTEPLVRLNVEARGDAALMQARTEEILGWLDGFGT